MKWILAIALLLSSTSLSAENSNDSVPWIEVRGHRFFLEISDDDKTRSRGLMFREKLADNFAMLFVFPSEGMMSFWMKNTLIPLDIIYLDRQFRIVTIVKDAQPCKKAPCAMYPSQKPARFVVEFNAGVASSLNLQQGDTVHLSNYVVATK